MDVKCLERNQATESVINHNGGGRGKIQTAHLRFPHRNGEASFRMWLPQPLWQTSCFLAEKEKVPRLNRHLGVRSLRMSGEKVTPCEV